MAAHCCVEGDYTDRPSPFPPYIPRNSLPHALPAPRGGLNSRWPAGRAFALYYFMTIPCGRMPANREPLTTRAA